MKEKYESLEDFIGAVRKADTGKVFYTVLMKSEDLQIPIAEGTVRAGTRFTSVFQITAVKYWDKQNREDQFFYEEALSGIVFDKEGSEKLNKDIGEKEKAIRDEFHKLYPGAELKKGTVVI